LTREILASVHPPLFMNLSTTDRHGRRRRRRRRWSRADPAPASTCRACMAEASLARAKRLPPAKMACRRPYRVAPLDTRRWIQQSFAVCQAHARKLVHTRQFQPGATGCGTYPSRSSLPSRAKPRADVRLRHQVYLKADGTAKVHNGNAVDRTVTENIVAQRAATAPANQC
jgi:hypothetical protein